MKIRSAVGLLSMVVAAPVFAGGMSAAAYVKTAGTSDLFERQSAQFVLQTTTDPKIRDFASMMLSAHTKSTADVKTAAKQAKVRVTPPVLMPAQSQMIVQLRAATGTARDAIYIAQQKTAHSQALAVQQAYATGGTATPLKAAAAKIVPVVKMHIAMLEAM